MQTAVTSTSKNTTLNQIVVENYNGNKQVFNYACEVSKPSGVLDTILTWCREEMQDSGWKWQLRYNSTPFSNGQYIFYFNSERDYLSFVLRWA